MLRAAVAIAMSGMLAACADTGAPNTDSDRNPVADPVAAANDGMTAGSWQSASDGSDQSVAFRSASGELLFAVRCDVRGGLLFERHGWISRADLGMMQLRTGGTVRRLAASGVDDPPHVQARAPYNDRLIPALMRFEGPLEVRFEGFETLILPPSPPVQELTRKCQSSSRPPAAAAPAGPADAN